MGKWSSPPVRNNGFRTGGDAPPITASSTTGGDSPSHHHRHKSNAPEPLVMLISNRRWWGLWSSKWGWRSKLHTEMLQNQRRFGLRCTDGEKATAEDGWIWASEAEEEWGRGGSQIRIRIVCGHRRAWLKKLGIEARFPLAIPKQSKQLNLRLPNMPIPDSMPELTHMHAPRHVLMFWMVTINISYSLRFYIIDVQTN